MRRVMALLFLLVGCGEVEAPPMPVGPAFILAVTPACDITDGGTLDSLDGLTFVSSNPADDPAALSNSANGWEYVYRGVATGIFHGGVVAFPRVPCEQTFTLVPLALRPAD